jgi:AcrR family transcriptional regulator
MPSQRNASAARRVGDDVLLDAARECLLDIGFRRITLTDVARRAGVSRMTVYRRFTDVRSLVADLMTREFGELLAKAATDAAEAPTERERLVSAAVAGVRELWTDPLLDRLLDLDPELLLPYIVSRVGSTQRFVEQILQANIAAGQADGSIRHGDPQIISRAVYLMLQSFALSVRPAVSGLGETRSARHKLLEELILMLDGALRPPARQHAQT